MRELITILMPAFNAEAFIAEAVNSVLNQSIENWELIIIADDSRDYQHILGKHRIHDERIRFCATQKDQSGPNHSRNVGLKLARGQWLAPLDADDIYYPQRLEKLMDAGQTTGLALDNINLSGSINIGSNPVIKLQATTFGFEDFRKSLVPLLFLFNREIVVQGWDEDVVRGADTLFNLRALELAHHAGYVNEALHEYRIHNQSMCHAEGAEDLFIEAYEHTLARLNSDGLGFQSFDFRQKVIALIEEKQQINQDYRQAVTHGFKGNYQNFVQSLGLDFW